MLGQTAFNHPGWRVYVHPIAPLWPLTLQQAFAVALSPSCFHTKPPATRTVATTCYYFPSFTLFSPAQSVGPPCCRCISTPFLFKRSPLLPFLCTLIGAYAWIFAIPHNSLLRNLVSIVFFSKCWSQFDELQASQQKCWYQMPQPFFFFFFFKWATCRNHLDI